MNSRNTKKTRKKRLSNKFPCQCGHSKLMHGWAGDSIGDEWCGGLSVPPRNKYGRTYNCECERFVPDNLKYLEQCANAKKGKGK